MSRSTFGEERSTGPFAFGGTPGSDRPAPPAGAAQASPAAAIFAIVFMSGY
jgi:hypothetical protein